jgi:hypothetical protein
MEIVLPGRDPVRRAKIGHDKFEMGAPSHPTIIPNLSAPVEPTEEVEQLVLPPPSFDLNELMRDLVVGKNVKSKTIDTTVTEPVRPTQEPKVYVLPKPKIMPRLSKTQMDLIEEEMQLMQAQRVQLIGADGKKIDIDKFLQGNTVSSGAPVLGSLTASYVQAVAASNPQSNLPNVASIQLGADDSASQVGDMPGPSTVGPSTMISGAQTIPAGAVASQPIPPEASKPGVSKPLLAKLNDLTKPSGGSSTPWTSSHASKFYYVDDSGAVERPKLLNGAKFTSVAGEKDKDHPSAGTGAVWDKIMSRIFGQPSGKLANRHGTEATVVERTVVDPRTMTFFVFDSREAALRRASDPVYKINPAPVGSEPPPLPVPQIPMPTLAPPIPTLTQPMLTPAPSLPTLPVQPPPIQPPRTWEPAE